MLYEQKLDAKENRLNKFKLLMKKVEAEGQVTWLNKEDKGILPLILEISSSLPHHCLGYKEAEKLFKYCHKYEGKENLTPK